MAETDARLSDLEAKLLELLGIDGVHPNERKVLDFIKAKLAALGVEFRQDEAGNLIATIPGGNRPAVALVGHVDLVKSIRGRQVVTTPQEFNSDGTSILGGDNRTAVACMLALAEHITRHGITPPGPIELIFTVGEEQGCLGAIALDLSLVSATAALVLDLDGPVNTVARKAPGCIAITIKFQGEAAHIAHPDDGASVGPAFHETGLHLNELTVDPGVFAGFNFGKLGSVTNATADTAELRGEVRAYNEDDAEHYLQSVRALVGFIRRQYPKIEITVETGTPELPYNLDETTKHFQRFSASLAAAGLDVYFTDRIGLTDGSTLSARGLTVVTIGAAYRDAHSNKEAVNREQLAQMFRFLTEFCLSW